VKPVGSASPIVQKLSIDIVNGKNKRVVVVDGKIKRVDNQTSSSSYIGALVTSTSGELCKVIGVAIDGLPILEALDGQSPGDESTDELKCNVHDQHKVKEQVEKVIEFSDKKNFYKYSSAIRCGVKAKCLSCMNLYVKGSSRAKHMRNCPSKTWAVDTTW
jgi:hypothetical protein